MIKQIIERVLCFWDIIKVENKFPVARANVTHD